MRPQAFTFHGVTSMSFVMGAWREVVRLLHQAKGLRRKRLLQVAGEGLQGWRRVVAGQKRRMIRELGFMKKRAEDSVKKMKVWLACSQVLSDWRRVTKQNLSLRISRQRFEAQRQHSVTTIVFAAWAARTSLKARTAVFRHRRQNDFFRFAV